MKWYIAKLIFNIDINNGKDAKQFDEQLRLVSAKTNTEAYYKAQLIGNTEQANFISDNNTNVNWRFIDVAEVVLLNEIIDGMQLYSLTTESEKPSDYIQFTKLKANHFQDQLLQNN
jgi:hypothetical protein